MASHFFSVLAAALCVVSAGCAVGRVAVPLDASSIAAARGDARSAEEVDVAPEPIGGVEALLARVIYPRGMRDMRVSGEVVLGFVVRADGSTEQPVVLASPHADLSAAALDALRGVTFTSGRLDGRDVPVWVEMPIGFYLR